MKELRILHITPWFPNEENKVEGIFVWEHVKSLIPHVSNEIFKVSFGAKKRSLNYSLEGVNVTDISLKPLIDKWAFKEYLAVKQVNKIIAQNHTKFDFINFHVAYPNAIKIGHLKKKYPSIKFVITEHWTAYHYNFNLPEESRGRKRIASIFHHNIPIITVSNALKQDLEKFSSTTFPSYIIPNVIKSPLFTYTPLSKSSDFTFASINNWNPVKNAEVLVIAFYELSLIKKNIKLILGGGGTELSKIKKRVSDLNLTDKVEFTGRIPKKEVPELLKRCNAYVQCSNYETFSVITAEALACGRPVVTGKWGGVLDFVNESNGILIEGIEVKEWTNGLKQIMDNIKMFDTEKISKEIHDRFNSEEVGEKYFDALISIKNAK